MYLCIIDIPNGKAEFIFLDVKMLNIANLRGFGSDGAAVMRGRLSGVATRRKSPVPTLVSIHCVNPSTSLGSGTCS